MLHYSLSLSFSIFCPRQERVQCTPTAVALLVHARAGALVEVFPARRAHAATVREIAAYGGDTTPFVTPAVQKHLKGAK